MSNSLERATTVNTSAGDVELGVTDALQKHFSRHVVQRRPVSQRKLDFEHRRPRLLREMMAEATGVFFYGTPPSHEAAISSSEPLLGSTAN